MKGEGCKREEREKRKLDKIGRCMRWLLKTELLKGETIMREKCLKVSRTLSIATSEC